MSPPPNPKSLASSTARPEPAPAAASPAPGGGQCVRPGSPSHVTGRAARARPAGGPPSLPTLVHAGSRGTTTEARGSNLPRTLCPPCQPPPTHPKPTRYNPTWHVIVGRNFGSYVTHETKHFIYFYLGQIAILLFKSG